MGASLHRHLRKHAIGGRAFYLGVEIFEPAISSMDISQFQSWLKDIYSPYIQRNGDGFEEVEATVYDSFVNHHKITLHYSDKLPCINVGKPKRPTYFSVQAQLISVLRAPKSKEGYAAIGGGSPQRQITNE